MFEFFLITRVSFWLVRAGLMPCRCAGTLPFFRKRHPHARFALLLSRRRRCGGRAWSDRHLSQFIGVKSPTGGTIPKDKSGLILRLKHGTFRCCVRCLTAFNGTHFHWGCRYWRRDRWLRWLGAVLIICWNHGHSSQHIEWVGRKFEINEAVWHNWMLTAKPIWNCGFNGIRINFDNLWLQRSDGGDCDCLPCHRSWLLCWIEDCRSIVPSRNNFFWWVLQIQNISFCGWKYQRGNWVHRINLLETRKFAEEDEFLNSINYLKQWWYEHKFVDMRRQAANALKFPRYQYNWWSWVVSVITDVDQR